jgi:putative phage-type endonuclease
MEQRSEEWFKARKNRVTGSAVGAILGLSPFAKPDDAMRRMVREYHGLPTEFKGNVATEWGTRNEAGAIVEYEMTTDRIVKPASFVMYEHWLGASPDGYVSEKGLIEVKCPFSLRHEFAPVKFKLAKEQPHYYAQIQIQLFVTNREWCDFWQWTPSDNNLERVHRDQKYLDTILRGLKFFYERYLIERENLQKYASAEEIDAKRNDQDKK